MVAGYPIGKQIETSEDKIFRLTTLIKHMRDRIKTLEYMVESINKKDLEKLIELRDTYKNKLYTTLVENSSNKEGISKLIIEEYMDKCFDEVSKLLNK